MVPRSTWGRKASCWARVEAMDLVDEDDGAGAVLAGAFGVGHHLLDLLDPGQDGGELDEFGLGDFGDDLGQSGFADAGRPPEDDRTDVVALDLHAQRLARRKDVLLPDELIEGARPHAVGKRAPSIGFGRTGCVKETHSAALLCRLASYSTIDAAMPAFRDSTLLE